LLPRREDGDELGLDPAPGQARLEPRAMQARDFAVGHHGQARPLQQRRQAARRRRPAGRGRPGRRSCARQGGRRPSGQRWSSGGQFRAAQGGQDGGHGGVVGGFVGVHHQIGFGVDRVPARARGAPEFRGGRPGGGRGRVSRRAVRRTSTSRSARSQTLTARPRIMRRVSGFKKAPPPVASTRAGPSRRRLMTRRSPLRNSASPRSRRCRTPSRPAATSISASASLNGRRRALARRGPPCLARAHEAHQDHGPG
jgi:hypothetical protein